MTTVADELGMPVALPAGGLTSVVSLVPSLTEAIELTVPGVLVGATDYCVHPSGLAVSRVGGSKYPTAVSPDPCAATDNWWWRTWRRTGPRTWSLRAKGFRCG